jgi:hypothetical protein
MDTDDQTRLHAECSRLECALLANEKALDAVAAVPDGQDERARLTAEVDAQLAELGVVNTKLSVLRGRA